MSSPGRLEQIGNTVFHRLTRCATQSLSERCLKGGETLGRLNDILESRRGRPDMRRADRVPCLCAIGRLQELLTRPWTLHILWSLSENGPIRFGALRKSVNGMSARVLTERLRTLEAEGFMSRHCKPTIPLAVTYHITDRMKDIEKVWVQLENLSRKCRPEESTARGSTAHSAKAD
jgi:DNA-binding HxlR family transcriptional regulator